MIPNTDLGRLLSEHGREKSAVRGLYGCGILLLVPLVCGLWATYAALTTDQPNDDSRAGLLVALVIVGGCLLGFGAFAALVYFSPRWLNKYRVRIYEKGFELSTMFKTQTCLWDEIKTIHPMLLTTPANRAAVKPADFHEHGGTKYGGIYEVYKSDGTKILVSRQYSDMGKVDAALKPYCDEMPEW